MEFFYHVFLIRDLILTVEKAKAKSLLKQNDQPARTYLGIDSMKQLGVPLLPLDASPSQGYAPPPSSYISSGFSDNLPVPIYTTGWREALWS